MTNDTASILAKHQRHELGMSSGSPDTCACGEKVMPDPETLAADGTARNITDRRDEAFAAHQAEMLKPRELEYDEYPGTGWLGNSFRVGDRVTLYRRGPAQVVARIFKTSKRGQYRVQFPSGLTDLAQHYRKVPA